MVQAGSLIWLIVGASLLGVVTRVADSAGHVAGVDACSFTRRGRCRRVPGSLFVWLALYVGAGDRQSRHPSGTGSGVLRDRRLYATTVDASVRPRSARGGRGSAASASTLIFPMALVAAEFLRSRFSPSATWGSIAYTQYGNLPLMQVAAFVGIWGITFLIAWFASTFDWAWSRGLRVERRAHAGAHVRRGARRRSSSAAACAWRWRRPTGASIRTATLNRPVDLFAPGEMTRIAEGRVSSDERARLADKLTRLHDWFLDGSRREARAGARLIVWPEQNLLIFKEDEPAFLERAQRLAADERIYLAMGLGTVSRWRDAAASKTSWS